MNQGLLWSMAAVYSAKGNETSRYIALTFTDYYSDNRALELTCLGAISMCLTLVNIVCIYIAGILVFKVSYISQFVMECCLAIMCITKTL